ncbi:hypothetical protein OG788_14770 [Streptomyces sp. NBC_00647]|uniref:hypothetical protein n=1 Tax=Streptomyces sp. NBC_00647 TaxID=2975796 RepID=UPI00324DFDF9
MPSETTDVALCGPLRRNDHRDRSDTEHPTSVAVSATVLVDDLRIEQDLARWFPIWGAPGL